MLRNERLVLNVHTGEHTQSIRSRSKGTIRGGRRAAHENNDELVNEPRA